MLVSFDALELFLTFIMVGLLAVLTLRRRSRMEGLEGVGLAAFLLTFLPYFVFAFAGMFIARSLFGPTKGLPGGAFVLPVGVIVGWLVVTLLPFQLIQNAIRQITLYAIGILIGAVLFSGFARLLLAESGQTIVSEQPPVPATMTAVPPTETPTQPPPTAIPATLVPTLHPLSGSLTGLLILELVGEGDPCGFGGAIFEYDAIISDGVIEIDQRDTNQVLTGTFLPDEQRIEVSGEADGYREDVSVDLDSELLPPDDPAVQRLLEESGAIDLQDYYTFAGEYALTDPADAVCTWGAIGILSEF